MLPALVTEWSRLRSGRWQRRGEPTRLDPNAALRVALDYFSDDDEVGGREMLESLVEWLAKGGTSPKVEKVPLPMVGQYAYIIGYSKD